MIAASPLHRGPARKRLQHIVGTGAIFLSACASAQLGTPDPTSELQRQDRQRQELRQSLEVPPWSPSRRTLQTPNHQRLPDEQACIVIRSVTIEGTLSSQALLAALNGRGGDDSPNGRCLGSQGVTLLIQRAQQALVAQGHITSHVHVPEQDLNSGELVLRHTPQPRPHVRSHGLGMLLLRLMNVGKYTIKMAAPEKVFIVRSFK